MEHMDTNISRITVDLHDLRTSTEARFESVHQKFDQKFAAVNERFDTMNDRISTLHVTMLEKFGEMDKKFADVNAKFGGTKVGPLTVLGGGFGFGIILNIIGHALHWF